ncbi:MAG TPA: cyclic nucleotide-binding domain-containing protein [Actinomycetota bacterium]
MNETTVDTLHAIALFESVPADALEKLAERAAEVRVAPGQVLIEIGQPGAGLFVLQEGLLEVDLPSGRVVELGPGQFVGEIALLTDRPHVARVRAKTEARCLAIARADFAALLQDAPQIAVAMLPVLAQRLADGL